MQAIFNKGKKKYRMPKEGGVFRCKACNTRERYRKQKYFVEHLKYEHNSEDCLRYGYYIGKYLRKTRYAKKFASLLEHEAIQQSIYG